MSQALLPPALVNPDGQPPLPVQAALDYAQAVTGWAQLPLPASVRVLRDQAYGPHRLQRYHLFAPLGAHAAPVLVFWHGGGWTHGYRDWVSFMAPAVVGLGMVLVAPSYRLAPEHPLPGAHQDSMALLAALQRDLPAQGGAADRLYLAGHSAGGHLAALAALRLADQAAAGIPAGAVRGCLPISGILDLHDPAPPPGSLEERVYTTVLRGQDPAQDCVHSPLYWAAGNRLPFVLTLGAHDSARVQRSNRRMLQMLQAQAGAASLVVEPGRDHFQTHLALRDAGDPWYQRLAALVARTSTAST